MQISSFGKKISSVKQSTFEKKKFEIIFRYLEHVIFCKILLNKFHL